MDTVGYCMLVVCSSGTQLVLLYYLLIDCFMLIKYFIMSQTYTNVYLKE